MVKICGMNKNTFALVNTSYNYENQPSLHWGSQDKIFSATFMSCCFLTLCWYIK